MGVCAFLECDAKSAQARPLKSRAHPQLYSRGEGVGYSVRAIFGKQKVRPQYGTDPPSQEQPQSYKVNRRASSETACSSGKTSSTHGADASPSDTVVVAAGRYRQRVSSVTPGSSSRVQSV